jgi:hypothetical protein
MPGDLVEQYLRAIPGLQAAEALMASQVVRVGSGWLKPSDARKIISDWIRIAEGSKERKKRKQRSPTSRSQMASMGLGVRTEKSND